METEKNVEISVEDMSAFEFDIPCGFSNHGKVEYHGKEDDTATHMLEMSCPQCNLHVGPHPVCLVYVETIFSAKMARCSGCKKAVYVQESIVSLATIGI